jgi:hypothetical protein
VVSPTTSLGAGAIGGLVAGSFLALSAVSALGFLYWRLKKRAAEKTRENAILHDRVSGVGFSQRIEELLSEESHGRREDSWGRL